MTGEPPTETDTAGAGLVTSFAFGLWTPAFGLWPLGFGLCPLSLCCLGGRRLQRTKDKAQVQSTKTKDQKRVTNPSPLVSSFSMKFFTVLSFALLVAVSGAAQTTSKPASASAGLVAATEKSKAAAEQQIPAAEEAVKKANDSLKLIEQLASEGLVAQVEVERAREELKATEARVKELQKQVAESIQLVADLKKAELVQAEASRIKQLTKPTLMRINSGGSVIRATGGSWSMTNLSSVQQFFSTTFGRALPISTIGQSATHNRLGWDHRNAVDVGVHPDSKEGQALIGFLQSANIPFLAFKSAIPGVATGPHIHIGSPSHRLG